MFNAVALSIGLPLCRSWTQGTNLCAHALMNLLDIAILYAKE